MKWRFSRMTWKCLLHSDMLHTVIPYTWWCMRNSQIWNFENTMNTHTPTYIKRKQTELLNAWMVYSLTVTALHTGHCSLASAYWLWSVNSRWKWSQEDFVETYMRFQLYNSPCEYRPFVIGHSEIGLGRMKCYAQPSNPPNSLGPTMIGLHFNSI
jgi:hypothetical protein